jgi:thiamine biosynthesis lipoprotein
MNRAILHIIFCLFVFGAAGQEKDLVTVKRSVRLMGSEFEITVVTQNEDIGYINIDEAIAEITRVEKLISSWDDASETTAINNSAGIKPVSVSLELYKLIERSIKLSEITDGAFDISYASLDNVWRFDGSMEYLPTPEEIRKAVLKINYRNIVLNEQDQTVFLKEKGMKIGFGAIGKGYAADRAKQLLVSKQVPAGMINASGDITTWGYKATGEKWLLGIANPLGRGKIFTWIPLIESAAANTGNHDKFIYFNGKKYTNILDPKSGYPAIGINKVTVFAKDAELSDALSTAVYVLGKDRGIELINKLGEAEVILIDVLNNVHTSNGIQIDNASY